jgi:2-amino-4-hydroxy-6-hydroxymethyldihydropteridine diphosphokinase
MNYILLTMSLSKRKTYLLLGSNIGKSEKNLEKAKEYIEKSIGKIIRSSSVYTSKAWGKKDQPDFLNQVLIVNNHLTPSETIQTILSIEEKMGRVRKQKNEPRIIDIDILFYDKEIINTANLTVPHPLIQERNFVLRPLNELSPQFIHPILKKSVHTLLNSCKDPLAVEKK